MNRSRLTLTLACLLLVGACGFGDSGDDDADASPTSAATTTSGQVTATSAATPSPKPPATSTASPTSTPAPSSPTAEATATSTTPAASPTTGSGPTATSGTVDPEVQALMDEIEAVTVDVRGLPVLDDVPIAIISRDALRQNLIADLETEYSQADADQDTRALWLLRLIEDPGLDLYAFQLDLFSEQVLGYYDPERDELFVVSDADGISALAEFTLAHEFVHAIQDQHFDIEQVRFYDQGDNDRDTAAVALLEGDAELTQVGYLEQMSPERLVELLVEASTLSSEVVDSAPPYLRESLYFPYEAGITFVQVAFDEGGYDAVDAIYADPPRSTEQIIHPEKYYDERDEPVAIEMPDLATALGAGWEEVDNDSFGEFDISVMLRENGVGDYASAAEGWGGGRYAHYERDGGAGALMAVQTVWDTPEDAAEFRDALVDSLSGPLDGMIGDAGQGRFIGVREVDGAIWFVTSVDRAAVEAALAALGS